jgi:hypothetical protein
MTTNTSWSTAATSFTAFTPVTAAKRLPARCCSTIIVVGPSASSAAATAAGPPAPLPIALAVDCVVTIPPLGPLPGIIGARPSGHVATQQVCAWL